MNEPIEKLEAELAEMRPLGVSSRLARELSAIAQGIEMDTGGALHAGGSRPNRAHSVWADRFLVFAMGVGTLAACVIVALLTLDAQSTSPAPGKVLVVRTPQMPENAYAFTRTSSLWGDGLN